MAGIALNIAVATAVFFIVTIVWQGDLISTVFSAVVFALTFGAIHAALVIFRSDND